MQLNLTNGERLLLDRRRRGENQEQAAKRLKTTRSWVWMAESGRTECKKINLGKVKLYELVYIARRRAKLTQQELGEKLGFSREWIKQMELGKIPADPLVNCWGLK